MPAPSIDELVRIHDDDPAGAAEGLRALSRHELAETDLVRYGWLANHVLGEKLRRWSEALELQRTMGRGALVPAVLRNLAVAATFAGDVAAAREAETALAGTAEADPALVATAVRIGMLQYTAAGTSPEQTLASLVSAFREIERRPRAGRLAAMIAASLNNTLSALLEHEGFAACEPAVREGALDGARICLRLWREGGTWLTWERAQYLVALAAGAADRWADAAEAASAGLQIIAENGAAPVDRAFLTLELSRAYRRLGRDAESLEARREADEIAATFDQARLTEWYDGMAAKD